MTVKYAFNYSAHRLPRCCGVYEIGDFVTREINTKNHSGYKKYPQDYKEYKYYSASDSHKGELAKILELYQNRGIQFWFYKSPDYNGSYEGSEYTEDGFRQVVKDHPNCMELAEYVNPNSNNMINGFMILNDVTTEGKPEESEDDDDGY